MAATAREYLIQRFRGDAQALRDRLAALQRGTKLPGPDATTSRRMAEACDAVADLIEAIPPHQALRTELAALAALVPTLEQRAKASAQSPPVRSVYSGAATRIREVEAAEAKAREAQTEGPYEASAETIGDPDDEEEDDA